jgi:FAD/FMN-containing dehydrogenase
MLENSEIEKLKTSLRGQLIVPNESDYDSARKVFNAMIDRRPALIARCVGAADVISCVRFAREHDLPVSVRGGGHSIAGNAVCDDGLVIDLSRMKTIRVDPVRRVARADPGLLLGEFDRETQAFGLATTLGTFSITGIAGLTLGGGLGWLMGKHGLACDNLLSVDIVTADGRLLTASAEENPDLFWGVRGGSGNFGVVTSFEYQLHPLGPVLAGLVAYPIQQAPQVLRFFREYAATCPDELGLMSAMLTLPDGNTIVGVAACYSGDLETGERVLRPLRSFGSPVADLFQTMRYTDVQKMIDWWGCARTPLLEIQLPARNERHHIGHYRGLCTAQALAWIGSGLGGHAWCGAEGHARCHGFCPPRFSIQLSDVGALGVVCSGRDWHELGARVLECHAALPEHWCLRELSE